mgnify:CR=1 FL=1
MIRMMKEFFLLETRRTTYCFRVTEQGFLQHLYYGRRLDLAGGLEALVPIPPSASGKPVSRQKKNGKATLESVGFLFLCARSCSPPVARAVSFFLRDDADFITGQVLTVDGGFIL